MCTIFEQIRLQPLRETRKWGEDGTHTMCPTYNREIIDNENKRQQYHYVEQHPQQPQQPQRNSRKQLHNGHPAGMLAALPFAAASSTNGITYVTFAMRIGLRNIDLQNLRSEEREAFKKKLLRLIADIHGVEQQAAIILRQGNPIADAEVTIPECERHTRSTQTKNFGTIRWRDHRPICPS